MQWMMLQQEVADDFVIATGKQYSVREFITWAASDLGITLEFSGTGVEEVGTIVAVSGDHAPNVKLGWVPEITAREMCREMVEVDHKAARCVALLKSHGLDLPVSLEG